MQSKIFAWFLIIIFSPLRMRRPLLWLMAGLLCLCQLGCHKPCPPCVSLRMSLPTEIAPLLRPVELTKPSSKYPELQNLWLLTDQNRKNILIDIELLRAFGYANQTIIDEYNSSVDEVKK